MDPDTTDLARARSWLAKARALSESGRAEGDSPAPPVELLELELACAEVETKVLKRRQYERAVGTAEEELQLALSRLRTALKHSRERWGTKAPQPPKEIQ